VPLSGFKGEKEIIWATEVTILTDKACKICKSSNAIWYGQYEIQEDWKYWI